MKQLTYENNVYRSQNGLVLRPLARMLPSVTFYRLFIQVVWRASSLARRGLYRDEDWVASSLELLGYLEQIGLRIDVSGIEHIRNLAGPGVIIANHMSILETLLLPGIIQPIRPVTFVVKQSLLDYPVFKHIMRSRDPIAVSRTNPRQDLKVVMEEGVRKIQEGRSIIVFPQTTRSHVFNAEQMSSIGVKLAKKASVPIVPLALKTDAMRNGSYLKDFGTIDRSKAVCFAFAPPVQVTGKGNEEQELVNRFIAEKLRQWGDAQVLGI